MKTVTILKPGFTKQGGSEKYARLLAEAFHKKNCTVTVLTTGSESHDFPFQIVNHKLKSRLSFKKVLEFEEFCTKFLADHPSDIVFGMERNSYQTHLRAGSGVHKSFLEHRKKFEPKWKALRHLINPLHKTLLDIEKKGFENSQLQTLFTNSELVKNEVLENYSVEPKKITVIHNGVEWESFQTSFDQTPHNQDKRAFQFLFLGHNFERKGLNSLLYGLKELSEKNFHLSIVGRDKNVHAFEKLVKKLRLKKNVTFYGGQKNILPFLQKADCLVIPSFYDPFANVTTEALAMGVFVVTSRTNGGYEILNNKTGAIIEDLTDPHSVATALKIAMQHPKTMENALQIRNSVKHLDFSKQLQLYLDICLN